MNSIIFRVDASTDIGTGHVMRCLTLADALRSKSVKCLFICRVLSGDMINYIQQKGYEVLPICDNQSTIDFDQKVDAQKSIYFLRQQDKLSDWLIIDHYKINIEWETMIRNYTKRVLVIDDLADRQHECDIILDQNLYFDMQNRYKGLLSSCCRKLLGPRYSLLRQEFMDARKQIRIRTGKVERLLVFFGGSDPTCETLKTLQALNLLGRNDIIIDVVVGQSNPQRRRVQEICEKLGFNYYCQINNMAQLMAQADLAIGAGGTTTWERCILGLPALVIVVAENQIQVTEAVASAGAIINIGWFNQVKVTHLVEVLEQILSHPKQLCDMSKNALQLMGNSTLSGTDEIIKVMEAFYVET